MFSVDKINIATLVGEHSTTISSWQTPFHGLEAVWTTAHLAFLQNLSLGLAIFFLSRVLANLYFMNNIDNKDIFARAKKSLATNSILFLVFFLFWLIRLFFLDGFAVNPDTKEVFLESNKYLMNFIQMPLVLILFLAGVVLVLWGIYKSYFKDSEKGIWYAGIGVVLVVFNLLLVAGFNNTAYYPSTFDLQSSLTIENSSSSHFTLTAMSYVSILVPFVLAYIWYAWKAMDNKKIDIEEIKTDSHSY